MATTSTAATTRSRYRRPLPRPWRKTPTRPSASNVRPPGHPFGRPKLPSRPTLTRSRNPGAVNLGHRLTITPDPLAAVYLEIADRIDRASTQPEPEGEQ